MKRVILSFTILVFAVTAWSQSGSKTKTFSWQGLSMSYPDNYVITDKEYDRQEKTYTFICTTPDDVDAVSMATISFSKNLAKDLSTSLARKVFFNDIIPAIVSGLESGEDSFKSLKTGDIKEFPIPYSNVSTDYTAKIESVDIQGRIVVFVEKDFIVSCILIADSPERVQELDEIIKTITVK
jgi:hypothetical protein